MDFLIILYMPSPRPPDLAPAIARSDDRAKDRDVRPGTGLTRILKKEIAMRRVEYNSGFV